MQVLWTIKSRHFLFSSMILAISNLVSCRQNPLSFNPTLKSPESSQLNGGLTSNSYDFCKKKGVTLSLFERAPWSVDMVQKVLSDLIQSEKIKGTTWSAYPIAYRRMMASRDEQRCNGGVISGESLGLKPDILYGSQLINHHLADTMSRWLYYQLLDCARMENGAETRFGFCALMAKVKAERYDALSATLATTAVYISSHITLSLSAVASDDAFWDEFPDPSTRRTTEPLHTIPESRLKWLKIYKGQYDLFNQFLANSFGIVEGALYEAHLLKNNNLKLGVKLAELGFCRADLFGKIRDKSFAAALDYVKGTQIIHHPMLRINKNKLYLAHGEFNANAAVPKAVLDVENFALEAVASSGARHIYRNLLGGGE